MKEINGTVTLAFVEEDNRQRVIFRVIPLCTREGGVFSGGAEDFPDEGSMRVVPDKREQSTFKDRMRSIGGLCAIHLISAEGKELVKVRQNRNYAPDQGEKNKLAIYSDVICEFTEGGCFEVLDMGQDPSHALTEQVLLHKNKVLYGPVKREEAAQIDESALRPFGNDQFLLHTIDTPLLGKHQIYWNPEAILNWRQRKNALRHRERIEDTAVSAPGCAKAEEAATPAPEGKRSRVTSNAAKAVAADKENTAAAAIEQPKAKPDPVEVKPVKAETTLITAETKPVTAEAQPIAPSVQPAADQGPKSAPIPESREADVPAPLPIGTKLDILDAELSFDEQLSRLDQTLSSDANRLNAKDNADEPQEDEPAEVAARFSGTPLVPVVKPIKRSMSKPESVHHVVERKLLSTDADSDDMGKLMENPIDHLRTCLDYVWQNADMRRQAMDVLSDNEAFMSDMLQSLRRRGLNLSATAAAQEQLAEIEAERLSLLMQLENARTNEKKYREEAISSLTHKLRAESERLKKEVATLTETKNILSDSLQTMSVSNVNQVVDFMGKHIQCLSGASEDRILLSPVIGCHYTSQELAENLRRHMNDSGYGVNDDDAMSLLIQFSVNDAICLRGRTEDDAARFAQVLLESFGLQSVSGRIQPNAFVELVSLLPEDDKRTPTVTVQAFGTESMSIYGHKTIYLLHHEQQNRMEDALPTCPVISVPAAVRRSYGRSDEWQAVKPASLSSFMDIRADAHPMQDDARKWMEDLKACLNQNLEALPQATVIDMSRFIEVASHKVRGGFLSAADMAVCHWIVPAVMLHRVEPNKLLDALAGLPRALEMLRL